MKHPNFQDFETETKKSAGAPDPPAPPSLAPLEITINTYYLGNSSGIHINGYHLKPISKDIFMMYFDDLDR